MSLCEEFSARMIAVFKPTLQPGYHWPSIYHFMQDKAKVMPSAVLSDKPGLAKECFRNAAKTALRRRNLIYCEGFAVPDIGIQLPLSHAWLYDPETGRVIETTWREPGLEYWGVAFTREYLATALLRRKYYGIIEAYDVDYPLMRMPPEELVTVLHPTMENLTAGARAKSRRDTGDATKFSTGKS